jgi:phosphatidylglycerol:prolipoprotein diacylglycerol transferase
MESEFFMRPVLFHWRGFKVWSYPAMVYFGMVAGIVASNAAAHAYGVNAFRVYVASLILLVPALLGAKLLYVVSHWSQYRNNIRPFWALKSGGAALYGGVIVVLPSSLPLLAALKIPVGAFWDGAVFLMLILMFFGRIGCLLNGCCAGRASRSWISMCLPNRSGVWARRLPTQHLEAGWGFLLLIFAVIIRRHLPFSGALFLVVAAGYAGGRLVLESTREETGANKLTIHHAISACVIVAALTALKTYWPH